jgi:hypothetical protein
MNVLENSGLPKGGPFFMPENKETLRTTIVYYTKLYIKVHNG